MTAGTFMPLAAATLLAAGAAHAADGKRSVEAEALIPAPPAAVLQAFLGEAELSGWWQTTRSLVEPEAGGVWSIAWDDWGEEKSQHAWTGTIETLDEKRLVIANMVMMEPDMPLLGPMRLELRVQPEGDGTRLHVSHGGYGYGEHWDEMYLLVVNGWGHVLGDLEEWAAEEY